MFFYMFGIDQEKPEACAQELARRGFSAVVCSPEKRWIQAVRQSGMDAYACVSAFAVRDSDALCRDVDGVERIWFSSGCPTDASVNARREEAWRKVAETEGLTGVFLDGARFASPASPEGWESLLTCFCPSCLARMTAEGMDAEAVRNSVKAWGKGTSVVDERSWTDWLRFRRIVVEETMSRFAKAVRSVHAHLRTGAFVFPASLGALVGQAEFPEGTLDFVLPMLYRRFPERKGPACLNHEYHALERNIGRERTKALTGVLPPENVLQEGFPPSALEEETRRARRCVPGTLAPIVQIMDERLAESIAAVRAGGAQGVGFFAYADQYRKYLPDLTEFSGE